MIKLAIHSVPRSGSTWLGEIVNSHENVCYKYQPLFSYALKGFLSPDSGREEIDHFFNRLKATQDDFLDQVDARKSGVLPNFYKQDTHCVAYKEVRYHYILENLLKKDSAIKGIGLIRHPLAVLNSWYHAPREFRRDLGWDFLSEWRFASLKNQGSAEEFFGYEKWKETALLFQKLQQMFPKQFKIIVYKDLLNETENTVEELFDFIGLEMMEQTQKFIDQSKIRHNTHTYSVFKQKKSDMGWSDKLPQSIVDTVLNDISRDRRLESYCQ